MAAAKDEDNKVMDVAKPGESKPETGSKPMVVGHKSILSDPDVKEAEPVSTDAAKTGQTMSSRDKVTIQPLSSAEEIKSDEKLESKSEEANEEEPAKEEPKAEPEKKEDKPQETTEPDEPEEKKSAEEIAADEEQAKLEKESQLQEIVKSKKYYVPIKAQSSASVKTFIVTFLLVCIVGALVIAALIDAEIIDLGVELPFDLL